MGLLDKLKQGAKDATGIGLSPQEQYIRAFERGVLSQPPNYESASRHFASACEKFQKQGDQAMAKRALANAKLYHLVATRDRSCLEEVIQALQSVPELERVGSQKELVPVGPPMIEQRAPVDESPLS